MQILQEGGPLPEPESGALVWPLEMNPGGLLCHVAYSSRFYGNWVCFRLLWSIPLTQGPSWWWGHRSVMMDSSEEDSGRLVGHRDWRLLFAFDLSWILLDVGSLFHIPYQDLLLKITHANGYYRAWPRFAVLVSGSSNTGAHLPVFQEKLEI